MFKKTRYLLLAALVCAALTVYAGVTYVHGYLRLETVVVTARNVLPGEVISQQDVKLQEVPASIVPSGIVTGTQDAVGKAVQGFLSAGTPVTQASLQPASAAGLAGKLNAYPGRQAIAIEANAYTMVGYGLKDGDMVDLTMTPKQGAIQPVTMQNIPILTAPLQGQQGGALVLGVYDDQRLALITALVQGQDVRITLRPSGRSS
jgi:Flp pilus assembly protein CpaB